MKSQQQGAHALFPGDCYEITRRFRASHAADRVKNKRLVKTSAQSR